MSYGSARFTVRVKPGTDYGYAWDGVLNDYVTTNGRVVSFDAAVWAERDEAQGIVNVMNQRVEFPEKTRADGKVAA